MRLEMEIQQHGRNVCSLVLCLSIYTFHCQSDCCCHSGAMLITSGHSGAKSVTFIFHSVAFIFAFSGFLGNVILSTEFNMNTIVSQGSFGLYELTCSSMMLPPVENFLFM
ncbi:hypothetical protein AMECASPLE_013070 [Ameca splendens]|uniref:Uncharacterized protein n=1 Tax=Ameca splendens TaxID=208324 RepID=A0ABV0YNR4_9TELE